MVGDRPIVEAFAEIAAYAERKGVKSIGALPGVGKCSKPMWQFGAPCFCDEPAYGTYIDGPKYRDAYTGELRRLDGKYCGYVPALACPAHGGPEQPVTAE